MVILLGTSSSSQATESSSTFVRRSSTMERRQGILSSLRSRFGRQSSNQPSNIGCSNTEALKTTRTPMPAARPAASPRTIPDRNPVSGAAPATRRPDRPGMNAFTTSSTEPPPAYTPPASGPPPSYTPAVNSPPSTVSANGTSTAAVDDPYAFLGAFDTVFLIDDSGSMAGRSWRETGQALETIAPICTARDADGIDLHFLNTPDHPRYRNVTAVSAVREIFRTVRPGGGTPTGQRLNQLLKPYLARCARDVDAVKPLNVIVITDGAPSDDVESVLIGAAKKLDKLDAPAWQVGVQFFQVGREPGAREHLRQLDDDLAELAGEDDMRDIVDTVPFMGDDNAMLTGDGILKVVLGAVMRRLDRRRSQDLHRR